MDNSETSNDADGAFTIDEFCRRYGIGRTAFYEEVNSNRLVPKKRGTRTLIPRDEARRWLNSLPPSVTAISA
jgi:hypothetical protein